MLRGPHLAMRMVSAGKQRSVERHISPSEILWGIHHHMMRVAGIPNEMNRHHFFFFFSPGIRYSQMVGDLGAGKEAVSGFGNWVWLWVEDDFKRDGSSGISGRLSSQAESNMWCSRQGEITCSVWKHGSTCMYIEISENSLHGNFTWPPGLSNSGT